MTSLVFVRDIQHTPLMPMSSAHARLLMRRGKAHRVAHPTFMLLQLNYAIPQPTLRPVVLDIAFTTALTTLTISVGNSATCMPLMRVYAKKRFGHQRGSFIKALVMFFAVWLPISHVFVAIDAHTSTDLIHGAVTTSNNAWLYPLQPWIRQIIHSPQQQTPIYTSDLLTALPSFVVRQQLHNHQHPSQGLHFHKIAAQSGFVTSARSIRSATTSSQDAP